MSCNYRSILVGAAIGAAILSTLALTGPDEVPSPEVGTIEQPQTEGAPSSTPAEGTPDAPEPEVTSEPTTEPEAATETPEQAEPEVIVATEPDAPQEPESTEPDVCEESEPCWDWRTMGNRSTGVVISTAEGEQIEGTLYFNSDGTYYFTTDTEGIEGNPYDSN